MSKPAIAITGDGQLFQIWPTHAMKRFPMATLYDRSPKAMGFRQAEVDLGRRGLLDPTGQAAARRIADNLTNPPDVDATVTFKGPVQNGTITVTCRNGTKKTFQIRLTALDDHSVEQGFHNVDAAIARCLAGPIMA